jgi:hypothetical protein
VPKDREVRNHIMSEAHFSKLSIHPGSSKIYHDLKHTISGPRCGKR